MKAKDLCAVMVDSAADLDSAMAVYGFLKEELYQYSSMDPGTDAEKVDALNYRMERLIMAFEGFELAVAQIQRRLRNTVDWYEKEGGVDTCSSSSAR